MEFYFSGANLQNDAFLVSQMNQQLYVPLVVVAKFKRVLMLTEDVALIVESMEQSKVCSMDAEKNMIKPNIKAAARNTIILRDIPSDTKKEELMALFTDNKKCATPVEIRSDVGDTWFIKMESENDAKDTLLHLHHPGRGCPSPNAYSAVLGRHR